MRPIPRVSPGWPESPAAKDESRVGLSSTRSPNISAHPFWKIDFIRHCVPHQSGLVQALRHLLCARPQYLPLVPRRAGQRGNCARSCPPSRRRPSPAKSHHSVWHQNNACPRARYRNSNPCIFQHPRPENSCEPLTEAVCSGLAPSLSGQLNGISGELMFNTVAHAFLWI